MTKDGLRQYLRAATRQGHHNVDHHPLMRPLTAPGLTVKAYGRVLHALLGLHQPLETAFHQAHAGLPDLAPFRQLALDRTALLTRDLSELAILDPTVPCWNGTAPTSVAEYVGWRYVVEGSVMGIAMLGPRIRAQLGHHCPLHFFWPHRCRRLASFLRVGRDAMPAPTIPGGRTGGLPAIRRYRRSVHPSPDPAWRNELTAEAR